MVGDYIHLCAPRLAAPNELRIHVAAKANTEAWFNTPPHQSELNQAVKGTMLPNDDCQYQYTDFLFSIQ
jgi:hypothetical protein